MVTKEVPHRVLILSADMGEGHNAAAAALTEAIAEVWPGCEVERIDTIEEQGPRFGKASRWGYAATLRWIPKAYDAFYKVLCRYKWFADPTKAATAWFFGRRMGNEITKRDVDLVISTYPFGSAALSWLRFAKGVTVPSATFIPALHVHPYWIFEGVDLNFVMYPEAAQDALTPELAGHMVLGAPPVRKRFGTISKEDGRKALGIDPEAFMVLVTGGAWGLGAQEHAVKALIEMEGDLKVVTVCGRNEELRQRLEDLGAPEERFTALGYVDTMPELMAAADVVVTNGAGVTVLEALRTGRPVIAFEPLAGHGKAATAVMERMGLAISCSGPEGLVSTVRRLLSDRTLMARLEQAGREFGKGRNLLNDVRRMGELLGDAPEATSAAG